MKRMLSALLSAIMLLGLLAGCSQNGNNGNSSGNQGGDGDTKEPVTITAMITQSRNYDGLKAMIQKLKDEENITIDCQVVPDDQYQNMMIMKFNTGESADIVDFNLPDLYDVIDVEKFCADLSGESWVSELLKPETVTYNGKVYGFPFQSLQGVHGLIYNKDVFDKLGIAEPTSWDEFLAACEKIKAEGDGIVPIHFPKDTWVPQVIVSDNMTKVYGKDGLAEISSKLATNEAKWNEEEKFAEVIDYYLDLFAKGYVNEDYLSATYDDCIAAVGSGEAAMSFNGDFFAASILEAYPDANIGMCALSMPTAAEDMLTANTASVGFVANKDSDKLDTVKRVFELWSTPEYANLYFESRPGFPAFNDVDGGEIPTYLEGLNEKYISTGNFTSVIDANVGVGKTAISNYLWLYYLEGPAKGMTGQEILDKFQPDYENYMKENQQPGF